MNGVKAKVSIFQKGKLPWVNLEVDGAGYEECEAEYHRRWRKTPFFCIERVLAGSGSITDGKAVHCFSEGDCFFYGGESSSEYRSEGTATLRKTWIRFSGADAAAATTHYLGASVGVIPDSRGGPLELAFESCRGEAERPSHDSAETMVGYLHVILTRLRRLREIPPAGRSSDQLFENFKSLIDENFERWNSTRWGAHRLPASSSYLSRIFKLRMGMSPHRYLIWLKLQRAAYLLTNSEWSVKEIASKLGYDDPLYFSRVFSREFGYPPSALQAGGLTQKVSQ